MQKGQFSCKVQMKITYFAILFHMNHFCKVWHLFFILSFLNFSHQKSNTILHHKINGLGFIFSLDNLNERVRPIFSLQRFTYWSPSLFSTGRRASCLPRLINFASTYSITTFCSCFGISEVGLWVKYGKVVLLSANLFFLLQISWHYEEMKNSEDVRPMHPGYTSGINNDRKVHLKSSMTHEYNTGI